jgi:hypothetical protein
MRLPRRFAPRDDARGRLAPGHFLPAAKQFGAGGVDQIAASLVLLAMTAGAMTAGVMTGQRRAVATAGAMARSGGVV